MTEPGVNEPGVNDARTAELAANLAAVWLGIARACEKAGRDPASVTLVAVTKTWPADDVRRLAVLGVRDVAENRDQEASDKAQACSALGLRWHFVGQLQTNKVRSVARYADVVHAVDRERLIKALDRAAIDVGRQIRVLLQVSLEQGIAAPTRGGARPEEIADLADGVEAAPGLSLGGVMGVAPLGSDPDAAFARLHEVAEVLRAGHPGAMWISAGMSQDADQAIRHGATHVRIGSSLLGNRPPLR